MINSFSTRLLCFFLIFCSAGWSITSLNTDSSLNRKKIKELYFEGEFSKVIQSLESFRKMNPNPDMEDKIFMYKYLSVVYAANPETRSKGESYMYQLLKIVPTASLIDMYISDTIQAIFNKVKTDFEVRTKIQTKEENPQPKAELPEAPKSEPAPPTPSPVPTQNSGNKKNKSKSWVYWTLGGAAVAGAVAGFIILSNDNSSDIPPDTVAN